MYTHTCCVITAAARPGDDYATVCLASVFRTRIRGLVSWSHPIVRRTRLGHNGKAVARRYQHGTNNRPNSRTKSTLFLLGARRAVGRDSRGPCAVRWRRRRRATSVRWPAPDRRRPTRKTLQRSCTVCAVRSPGDRVVSSVAPERLVRVGRLAAIVRRTARRRRRETTARGADGHHRDGDDDDDGGGWRRETTNATIDSAKRIPATCVTRSCRQAAPSAGRGRACG